MTETPESVPSKQEVGMGGGEQTDRVEPEKGETRDRGERERER